MVVVCGIAFWWRLGYLGLIDPDEPFYAQSSREMLQARDWVTPRIFGHPQFEKPILFYWLTMGSIRIFGESEFAARAPAALFATLLVLMTWAFGARALHPRVGLLSAVVLATGTEFFVSARMVLTDMVFSVFVCGSVFSLWLACRASAGRGLWFIAACATSGLAVLTKGPLGALLPLLALVAALLAGERPVPGRLWQALAGVLVFLAIAVPWYAIMLGAFGKTYFDAFFLHENLERFFRAEHPRNNHLYYYPLVLIAGSVPWAPALAALLGRTRTIAATPGPPRFLGIWMLLSLGFFTVAQSKLPSYVLPLFVPLALLVALALDRLMRHGLGRREAWLLGMLGAFQAVPFLVAPRIVTVHALAWPFGLVAACLAVALIFLARRAWAAWIATTACGSLVLVLVCLTWAGPAVDRVVSTRSVSREVLHEQGPGEAFLASPLLVRGVSYYTRRPVAVLSDRRRPFFTPHPLPVVSPRDLNQYVRGKGTARCVVTARDWGRLDPVMSLDGWVARDTLGDKVIAQRR